MQKRQKLTILQKQKRFDRSKIILNFLKTGTKNEDIIFSNGKLFTIKAQLNKQNEEEEDEVEAQRTFQIL